MHVEGLTSEQLSQSATHPDYYHTACSRGVAYVCVLPAHRPDYLGMLLDDQHPNRLVCFCCKDSASRFCTAQNRKERARVARALAAQEQETVPFHPTRQAPGAKRQRNDARQHTPDSTRQRSKRNASEPGAREEVA